MCRVASGAIPTMPAPLLGAAMMFSDVGAVLADGGVVAVAGGKVIASAQVLRAIRMARARAAVVASVEDADVDAGPSGLRQALGAPTVIACQLLLSSSRSEWHGTAPQSALQVLLRLVVAASSRSQRPSPQLVASG